MKGVHRSAKAINLLEGNIVINLHDLGLDNSFINMTSKSQGTNEKINWTDQNLKLLCKGQY